MKKNKSEPKNKLKFDIGTLIIRDDLFKKVQAIFFLITCHHISFPSIEPLRIFRSFDSNLKDSCPSFVTLVNTFYQYFPVNDELIFV